MLIVIGACLLSIDQSCQQECQVVWLETQAR
jgi:hypothetical protein